MKSTLSIRLSPGQRARLEKIAVSLNCVTGSDSPSISRLIHAIADDFIAVGNKVSRTASGATSGKDGAKTERKKFVFHKNSPPKWWDVDAGGMDLADAMNKTGLTREELDEAGFITTSTTIRAHWPAWSKIHIPEWWRDSDDGMGMALSDCPLDASELLKLGLVVIGNDVMLPAPD